MALVLSVFGVAYILGQTEREVVRYVVCRAGKKGGESSLDDLKKAVWYLNQLVEKAELDVAETERKDADFTSNIHICPPSLWCGVRSWTD